MAQRYDLVTAREGKDGKSFFTRIGVAFENRDGKGFSLSFEALPLPSIDRDGRLQTRVLMMVPRERDDRAPARGSDRPPSRGREREAEELDDSVPF